MLNYRNTLFIFSMILIITVIIHFLIPVPWWLYLCIAAAFTLIIAWGSKTITAGFYLKSRCSGNRQKNEISLTFDDGPDAQVTPLILDVLKKHSVKATFFVIGSKAEKHPEIMRRIESEGHLIGNHSYSHHFFFDLFSYKRMHSELKRAEDIILQITGRKVILFRPPYGVTNPAVARTIAHLGYTSVGWSVKSNDTTIEDDSLILKKLKGRLKGGDILLFHDNKPWTVNVTDRLIQHLKENSISVAALDSLLNIHAYAN